MPNDLDQSYTACTRMARAAGSSFYPCFRLLPHEKRRGMIALYAFMRHTDDLADDETVDVETRRERLAAWEESLQQVLDEQVCVEPQTKSQVESGTKFTNRDQNQDQGQNALILPAVAETVQRFAIPPEYLTEVIDGVRRDLTPSHYQTFDELAEYSHLVASAVGLACIRIWGADDYEQVFEPARACGVAFQMVNLLRDISEDLDRGRVYLPSDDLDSVGYSLDELKRRTLNDGFRRLIALEVGRARAELEKAQPLAAMLHPDGRPILGMMIDVYRRLLDRVEASTDRLLTERVRLGRFEKVMIALRWSIPFLRPRR